LKRRVFTLDFRIEMVCNKKGENLSFAECSLRVDVLPKLIQQCEKQYGAGQRAEAPGRRAVGPEHVEITHFKVEMSRSKMETIHLDGRGPPPKKQLCTSRKTAREVRSKPIPQGACILWDC
jgi:hypothetical protein